MIVQTGCHDWDENFYCEECDLDLFQPFHIALDGEVFNLTGRGPVHTGKIHANEPITGTQLKSLIGSEIEGRKIKAIEAFAIMCHSVGENVGVLFEVLD